MSRISLRNKISCVAVAGIVLAGAWLLAGCGRSSQSTIATEATPGPKTTVKARAPKVVFEPIIAKGYKGPVGTISVPDDGISYILFLAPSGTRRFFSRLDMKSHSATLPVGRYQLIMSVGHSEKHPGYTIIGQPKSEINLTAGATTQLKLGGPYTAQATIKSLGGTQVSISLTMTDPRGVSYSLRSSKPPSFQVISASGQVLQEASFRYG